MKVNFNDVKPYLNEGYQILNEKSREFAAYSKGRFTSISHLIRQDKRLTLLTVYVANLMMIKIALAITGLFNNYLFDKILGDNELISDRTKTFKSILVASLFFSLMGGMNASLIKGMQLTVSPLLATTLSVMSFVTLMMTAKKIQLKKA